MTPLLPGLFSDDEAPQSVTVQPIARASRASGRRVGQTAPKMLAYRDALRAHGPATDHEIAAVLGWGLSSVNGRRGDWGASVVAVDRVKVGSASRARWAWVGA